MLLRAINMHPWKAQVQHIDFQRVHADQKIHMKVPLHFVNAEKSPGVKEAGGSDQPRAERARHHLPARRPARVHRGRLSKITVGHSIHVKELALPKGVEPVLHRGENPVVASASLPKAVLTEEEEAAAAAEAIPASQVPAAKQLPETAGSRGRRPGEAREGREAGQGGEERQEVGGSSRDHGTRRSTAAFLYGHQTDRGPGQSRPQARARPPQRRLLVRRAARGARTCKLAHRRQVPRA